MFTKADMETFEENLSQAHCRRLETTVEVEDVADPVIEWFEYLFKTHHIEPVHASFGGDWLKVELRWVAWKPHWWTSTRTAQVLCDHEIPLRDPRPVDERSGKLRLIEYNYIYTLDTEEDRRKARKARQVLTRHAQQFLDLIMDRERKESATNELAARQGTSFLLTV